MQRKFSAENLSADHVRNLCQISAWHNAIAHGAAVPRLSMGARSFVDLSDFDSAEDFTDAASDFTLKYKTPLSVLLTDHWLVVAALKRAFSFHPTTADKAWQPASPLT